MPSPLPGMDPYIEQSDIWEDFHQSLAVEIRDQLPVVPVPLNAPDSDVALDLNKAVHAIYDRAAYFMRIDYRKPPPEPPLSPDDARWVDELLQAKRQTP